MRQLAVRAQVDQHAAPDQMHQLVDAAMLGAVAAHRIGGKVVVEPVLVPDMRERIDVRGRMRAERDVVVAGLETALALQPGRVVAAVEAHEMLRRGARRQHRHVARLQRDREAVDLAGAHQRGRRIADALRVREIRGAALVVLAPAAPVRRA